MPWVVGVTFKPVTKVYYFDPAGFEDLQVGERVVVDTSRGRTLGTVTFTAREVPESEVSGTLNRLCGGRPHGISCSRIRQTIVKRRPWRFAGNAPQP